MPIPPLPYLKEYDQLVCARRRRPGVALEDGSATFDNIDTKVTGAIKVGKAPAPGSSAAGS